MGVQACRAIDDKLKAREAEQARLKIEIEQMDARRAAAQLDISPEALGAALATWRAAMTENQTGGNVEALRRFLMKFVSKVELGYNLAKITYSYPIDDFGTATEAFPVGALSYPCKVITVEWE